ncbi:MAG TPA: SRPBCC family protein [Usitatibacter sp.]|nr:SRPBCC family protein [Usitatibacter sp.]
MSVDVQEILVRKSIVVEAPREHVFRTFTERFDTWWPRSHHIGKAAAFTATLEPRAGGRWFERGEDGSECEWGAVLAWEPPERVVLRWDIGADFQPQPGLGTEVEVRFVAEAAERTRVVLEHRKLERYGDKAEMMRALFDSPNAWSGILEEFARAAAR